MSTSAATRRGLRETPEGSQAHSQWDVPVSTGNIIWVRVAKLRKPCNQCGRLTNYVQRGDGSPYGWRLCWKHLSKGAVMVKSYKGGHIQFGCWPRSAKVR